MLMCQVGLWLARCVFSTPQMGVNFTGQWVAIVTLNSVNNRQKHPRFWHLPKRGAINQLATLASFNN